MIAVNENSQRQLIKIRPGRCAVNERTNLGDRGAGGCNLVRVAKQDARFDGRPVSELRVIDHH